MANYEFWYCDEAGNRISYINNMGQFEFIHVLGDVGVLIVNIPRLGKVFEQNRRDRRIHVYRQPIGGALGLEFVAFINSISYLTERNGRERAQLEGDDPNTLPTRRIIPFFAEESETKKTDNTDDMMKEVVTENLINNDDFNTTAPSPTRSLSNINLTVQSDLGLGDSLTKSFAWKNVLSTLQGLQASSKTNGNEVFFGIVATTPTALQFQTKINQWGADRTQSTGINPIVFSQERGNLIRPRLTYDYVNESNKEYAGGQGQTTDRNVQTAQDDIKINESTIGLREEFAYSSGKTDEVIESDATDELTKSRSRLGLRGEITDHPTTRYGLHWKLGDKVTVDYSGIQFDVIIRSVRVRVNSNGLERIIAKIETEA